MNIIIKEFLLIIASYLIGSFSFAHFFSKRYKKVNIYKFGNRTADAGNVYRSVSKFMGILVWILDFLRVYFIVWAVGYFLLPEHPVLVLLVGFALVIGHYFPVHHKFIGGQEEITYVAFLLYFTFFPTLYVIAASLLIIFLFHQIRFAKYMLVLVPPFLCWLLEYIFKTVKMAKVDAKYLILTSILMGIISFIVSRRYRRI